MDSRKRNADDEPTATSEEVRQLLSGTLQQGLSSINDTDHISVTSTFRAGRRFQCYTIPLPRSNLGNEEIVRALYVETRVKTSGKREVEKWTREEYKLGITLALGGTVIAGILWSVIYINRSAWWITFVGVLAMPPSVVPFFVLLAVVAGPKQPGEEDVDTSIAEVMKKL